MKKSKTTKPKTTKEDWIREALKDAPPLTDEQCEKVARLLSQVDSITCPICHMTSYNPNDIREGFCGNCHDWTTPRRKS